MRNDLTTRLRLGSILGLTCAALLAFGSLAHAQQAAEDDEDTFEQRIIKSILGGLGANVGGGAGIDYRERSPLVIPPSLDLPPPDSAAAAQARNPAWPRDQERKKVVIQNRTNRYATPDDPGTSSRLSPDELRRGINPRAERVVDRTKAGPQQEDVDIGRPMRPKELGVTGSGIFNWSALTGKYANEEARFEGEPGRGSLTQPPTGYQTPSPNHPYGFNDNSKAGGWKVPTVLSRPEGITDN